MILTFALTNLTIFRGRILVDPISLIFIILHSNYKLNSSII